MKKLWIALVLALSFLLPACGAGLPAFITAAITIAERVVSWIDAAEDQTRSSFAGDIPVHLRQMFEDAREAQAALERIRDNAEALPEDVERLKDNLRAALALLWGQLLPYGVQVAPEGADEGKLGSSGGVLRVPSAENLVPKGEP